ncbi:MAG: hypothetical protein NXH85_12100 [Pseudomonadaceae bacterium]|nr:hypothetical protein [Pseudomonadaceae bacterium]
MLTFPDDPEFICDLVLQRTGPFIELGGKSALATWFNLGDRSDIQSFLNSGSNRRQYLSLVSEKLEQEAAELAHVLEGRAYRRVVSIGPGCALIETLLCRHLDIDEILLVDIEETATHQHGYSSAPSGYARLTASQAFIQSNCAPTPTIETCNPTRQALPQEGVDLYLSLLSMGFHYPCDDYAAYICENANAGANLVLDKKLGVMDPGFGRLLGHFQLNDIIHTRPVKLRTRLTKHDG